jgi:predicted RNA-binding protein with PIN domain
VTAGGPCAGASCAPGSAAASPGSAAAGPASPGESGSSGPEELGSERPTTILVDGYNVIGAVPDGWWRDRPGAVRRLLLRLGRYAEATGHAVEVVLDRPQPDLPPGHRDGVAVHYASRRGPHAADDRILELLDERPDIDGVEVVTSDRALADQARRRGARVTGAAAFLRRLDEAGGS